jgi:hypothetical protein
MRKLTPGEAVDKRNKWGVSWPKFATVVIPILGGSVVFWVGVN